VRPSDDTRSHTLAVLQRGYATGRLHTDTFSVRVDSALRAGSRRELHELAADLPGRWRDRVRGWWWAAFPPRAARLTDPALLRDARMTLGRAQDCELVFLDDTVSRHHARLELRDGRWFLIDLQSSNGTSINGRRVHEAEVRAGDRIELGAARFSL
jgi:hypothetical protein